MFSIIVFLIFLILAFTPGLNFFSSSNVVEKFCRELLNAWKTVFACEARTKEFKNNEALSYNKML
jgi:hypothetical protein